MKKQFFLMAMCIATILSANAQTVQVLDSVVSYLDGSSGVKYEYQYDKKGIAISETNFYWDDGINRWVQNSKCEYQYDANNNQTWITSYWDSSANMWIENKKYEYLYVDNNNQTWITSYWDSSSNSWVENKKYEYQYDNSKNQTLETGYFWDNAWTKVSTVQYDYYYSPLTVNSIFQVNKEQPVTVFPNPATNYITVKGMTGSIITVSDFSGGIVYKQVMAGESSAIDVSSWTNGTYLISVETGNNRAVSKIIKNKNFINLEVAPDTNQGF